jgi:serine/threonine protein kinase
MGEGRFEMTGPDAIYGRLAVGFMVEDRYRVGEIVGKGGSGLIYQATDVTTGQRVALKTLNSDLLSHPSAVARYHREARAAAGIGHPNICSVSDVGQLPDGRPFLVMELLTGRTLADRIRDDGAMPFPHVVNILTQTLSALEAAHAKKIVHRDIKPDNVFLTDRIRGVTAVKLLDFGIAKSLDENAELSLTRTGMVVGTPFYMAPEQARGETLDHRVDIYACGVLLFEMLTGRRPYHATNYNALMVQVLTSPPPDPRHLRPAVPSGFAAVVTRAMAKDKRERYADARGFLAALWELQSTVSEGLGPEEIDRIAQAVQRPNTSGRPSFDSMSDDIPVYHESEPPVPIALGHVEATDNETVTQPFVRPQQLRPPKRPSFRPSVSEVTEVMLDAPWLRAEESPSPPVIRRASKEPPSPWDDEPTRVDPPPASDPRPGPPVVTAPPEAAPKGVPRPPARVPRPKGKS